MVKLSNIQNVKLQKLNRTQLAELSFALNNDDADNLNWFVYTHYYNSWNIADIFTAENNMYFGPGSYILVKCDKNNLPTFKEYLNTNDLQHYSYVIDKDLKILVFKI